MPKFTFKTNKPEGAFSWIYSTYVDIKLKGKIVGFIRRENPFFIKIMVEKEKTEEDSNPNCLWKWVTLKEKSRTMDEAKEFLNKNFDAINKNHKIFIDPS